MSADKTKEKKPFLRKGTRQFLSNAQVRSQSTKPKIVDFGAEGQQQAYQAPPRAPVNNNKHHNQDEEIIIHKKNPIRNRPEASTSASKKPERAVEKPQQIAVNKKRQTSVKKQTALSDYLDNESGLNVYVPAKKPDRIEPGYKKTDFSNKFNIEKKQESKKPKQPSLKTNCLVQQQLHQDDSNDEDHVTVPNFGIVNNKYSVPHKPAVVKPKKQTEISYKKQSQDINFISDKSDDQQEPKYRNRTAFRGSDNKFSQHRQKQEPIQNEKASKIKMNYFNKANNQQQKLKETFNNAKPTVLKQVKPLSTVDIPKELKELIVKEMIAEKQQQLQQELEKLKQKVTTVKKEKERLDEQAKELAKARLEFEKQMQEKNRQFQQKLKNENSKLARQKKYMKQAQMSGKGDWKAKSQLEQVRKQMEQLKEEKKKIESKYKVENDSLRKKLNQQVSKNKLLAQQVKILEYGQLIQKQQQKQQTQQQNKQNKRNSNQIKSSIWTDAPQTTYLSQLKQQQFSLIQLQMQDYNYQANQFYQYYLNLKPQNYTLESQVQDADRVKRVYKNGKIQHEYFNKFLKQIFPFNYTVVNLWNGDIKQVLPDGTFIYYSKNSGATQFVIKNGSTTKEIIYFIGQSVQMKYSNELDPAANYQEFYAGGVLKRVLADGTMISLRKDARGNVTQI